MHYTHKKRELQALFWKLTKNTPEIQLAGENKMDDPSATSRKADT